MARSFYDTHDLMQPIVYGVVAVGCDDPVYIGMTKNASLRMDNYRNPKRCKNKRLAEWLAVNDAGFVVLYEGVEYKAKEAELIEATAGTLFNLVRGGDQNWRVHRRKPWMAKTGVKCPSDTALRIIGKDDRTPEYKAWRKGLSDVERCLHEVRVSYDLRWHASFMTAFEKWSEYAFESVSSVLRREGYSPDIENAT